MCFPTQGVIDLAAPDKDTLSSITAPANHAFLCIDAAGCVIRPDIIAFPYARLTDVHSTAAAVDRDSHLADSTVGQKEAVSDEDKLALLTAPVNHAFLCMDVVTCLIRPEMIAFPSSSLADFYKSQSTNVHPHLAYPTAGKNKDVQMPLPNHLPIYNVHKRLHLTYALPVEAQDVHQTRTSGSPIRMPLLIQAQSLQLNTLLICSPYTHRPLKVLR